MGEWFASLGSTEKVMYVVAAVVLVAIAGTVLVRFLKDRLG